MGFFGQEEQDAPEASGGFFKRFRAQRSSFVEPSAGAEPVLKRSSRQRARAEINVRTEQRDDSARTRPTNPQVSFLGRALFGGDIEDVDSTDVESGGGVSPVIKPVESVTDVGHASVENQDRALASVPKDEANHEPALRPFVPPKFERPSYESMAAAMATAEKHDANPVSAPVAEQPVHPAEPLLNSVTLVSCAADEQQARAKRPDGPPAVGISPSVRRPDAPVASADDLIDDDNALNAPMSGRPELVSVESLPEFKRVLTFADDDAALCIPASARKEFVAVELQPGVAVTVATSRFAEKAQYATFIKDLGSNDILVRECTDRRHG